MPPCALTPPPKCTPTQAEQICSIFFKTQDGRFHLYVLVPELLPPVAMETQYLSLVLLLVFLMYGTVQATLIQ